MSAQDWREAPPQAEDSERTVLGLILNNPAILAEVDGLAADDFYRPEHRLILKAMRSLRAAGAPLALVALKIELDRAGQLEAAGGVAYVAGLADGVPRLDSALPWCRIVSEASLMRKALRIADGMRAELHENRAPGAEIVSRGIAELSRLAEGGPEATSCEGAGLLRACTGAVEALLSGEGAGRSTGFPGLDALNVTLSPGEVTVIAAPTSRGKSALGVQIAYHAAKAGGRSMVGSL